MTTPPEPAAQLSERPEPPLVEIEVPIVRAPKRSAPTLDEDDFVVEIEVRPARQKRDLVNLFFEEEVASDDDGDERMELVENERGKELEVIDSDKSANVLAESTADVRAAAESQNTAAQEKPEPVLDDKVAVAESEDNVELANAAALAELKPILSVEIRKAVEIPALSETANPKLLEPVDLARGILRKRPAFKFLPVYRAPWTANRDSFAFHHNPLWFEDPNLERCGRGQGNFTSVVSFLQFNTNVAFLPYRMTAEPPNSCVRTLPDCTVCQKFGRDAYLPPWSLPATAVQGAAIFGFIYAIP